MFRFTQREALLVAAVLISIGVGMAVRHFRHPHGGTPVARNMLNAK